MVHSTLCVCFSCCSSHPALCGKVIQAVEFDSPRWQVKTLPNSLDTEGHGTHVAGLICGEKIGVAPQAQLINGLLLPQARVKPYTFVSNLILAIEWVALQPEVQIVNLSAGISGYYSEMKDPINDLLAVGILPVCAVGNEGRDETRSPGNYSTVLSVGAINKNRQVSSFSSSGTIVVDRHSYKVPHLVAPGEKIYSCVTQGGYEAWNGTSMAAPIVSGIAALILEKCPDITIADLREVLLIKTYKTCL